jgi:hypothetical protein
MKKALKAAVLAALLATATSAHATPSTTFWTPATTYVQPYLVPHVTYDTYVNEKGAMQNDYGLTMGVLPFEKFQGEIGVDSFLPGPVNPVTGHQTGVGDNTYLNAKLGIPENAYSDYQPGLSFGIQNLGFTKDYSDYKHLHAEIGKTFGAVGNVTVGGYYGLNDKLYVSSTGKTERSGFMAAYTSADINIGAPGLNKINFIADYASGNNVFGAYGGGIGIFFTPAIDILTGPVWFNDQNLAKATFGSSFMWTVQLDVDIEFRKPTPPPAAAK